MSTGVIAVIVLAAGVGVFLRGIAMLGDWRRIGTRWAVWVMAWQERLRRRQLIRGERQLRQLSVFGGILAVVIGLGWVAAGIGLAAGWIK